MGKKDTSNDGFWGTIFSSTKELDNMIPPLENSTTNIKGVYIHGGVGCGKTHLMKLFYAALPNNLTKQNVHFHKFMLGIHKRMHTERKKKHGSNLSGDSILNLVVNEIFKHKKIIFLTISSQKLTRHQLQPSFHSLIGVTRRTLPFPPLFASQEQLKLFFFSIIWIVFDTP